MYVKICQVKYILFIALERRALNSHKRRHWLNVKIWNPFKDVTVCIFNPTWFKFWINSRSAGKINLHLNSISTWPEGQKGWGGNYFFYAVFFKCWGFPTVLYLTFLGVQTSWVEMNPNSVYSGRFCVHIMNDWVDWVDFTSWTSCIRITLQNWQRKMGKKWLPCHTSAQFQASVSLSFLQTILGFAACLKWSEGWLKKQILHTPKCLRPVGGSLKCSTDRPAVTDLHPGGSSVDTVWKGV